MTAMPDPVGDAPTHDEIRDQIDRIAMSEVFVRSPQLGAFLRFVVEAVLHGKADRIKAYTIGVEVLRRDTKFDPQLDPIVRVEATRLRRAIERYYSGLGADDPVIVDLPRGSYVPTFRKRETNPPLLTPFAGAFSQLKAYAQQPPTLASLTAIAAIAIAVISGVVHFSTRPPAIESSALSLRQLDARAAGQLPPGNGMPTIMIEPLRVIGTPQAGAIEAERLHARIGDAVARFDTVNVASGWLAPRGGSDSDSAAPRADYRLTGTVEYAGGLANAWFQLTDEAEGTVVWSRAFEGMAADRKSGVAERKIVVGLTNALLQSYGVIRARDRAKHLASGAGDPRYRCILEAADAIRTADRRSHDRARACLENLTALDPSFAVGFTFLSLIYNREFQLGYETKDGDAPPLDRALRMAEHAVALSPESSRGHLALMVIQFNRRDFAAALAAGEKALTLNGFDMLALGEYGGRLILSGDVERGLRMLEEAGSEGTVRPSWHRIYLSLGYYLSGDVTQAAFHANQIPTDNVALGQVAKALAAHAGGDRDRGQAAIGRLIALQPVWRDDPRRELARLIADPSVTDRLARDLAAAGLPSGS